MCNGESGRGREGVGGEGRRMKEGGREGGGEGRTRGWFSPSDWQCRERRRTSTPRK